MQNKSNKKKALTFFWGFATLGCMILIFYMSHKPAAESGEMSGFIVEWLLRHGIGKKAAGSLDFIVRKCAHMSEYFALTVCESFLLINIRKDYSAGTRIFAAILAVLYAMSDEIHQLFVPGRAGRVLDVIIDSVGITLAFLIITLYFKCRKHSTYSV